MNDEDTKRLREVLNSRKAPIVQSTFKMTCHNPECPRYGHVFQAVLGAEPILDAAEPAYDLCIFCNTYSMGAARENK